MARIKAYEIKRRCNDPKFLVVTTILGQSIYYMHHSLIGAVVDYCWQYLTKKKYKTMNFRLRQVMITDKFEEE